MINKILSLSSVLLLMIGCSGQVAGDPEKEKAAAEAAELWVKLIDNSDFDQSWESASEYLRKQVTKEQFVKTLKPVRAPLGEIISRKVKITKYSTSVPGGPDGEYVTVQFESSFKNKKAAIETITPMLEKDGKWRVSGYYIK